MALSGLELIRTSTSQDDITRATVISEEQKEATIKAKGTNIMLKIVAAAQIKRHQMQQ